MARPPPPPYPSYPPYARPRPPLPPRPRMQTAPPPPPRNPTLTGRPSGPARSASSQQPRPGAPPAGSTPAPRPPLSPRTGAYTRPGMNGGAPPASARPAAAARPTARLVSRAGQNPKNPTQPAAAQRTAPAPAAATQARGPALPRPATRPAARRAAPGSPRRPLKPLKKARKALARRGLAAAGGPPTGPARPAGGAGPSGPAKAAGGGSSAPWAQGRALWGVVVLLLLVVGAIGGYYGYLFHEFNAPGPSAAAERLQVSQGASLKGVLNQLAGKGLLGDKLGTLMYLRLTGENPRVKVGTYEFPAHASPAKIIAMLDDGKVVLEQVTIVEGSTFADFRRTLDESPVVTHALRGKSEAQVMAALGHAGELPEGRFFPDTYLFAAQTSDLEILQIAYSKMQHLVDKEWPGHDPSLPYSSPYEALTLASLVEKETGVPAERARIAGVFINRLRKGMRLQTDPAVIYGLGPAYDGSIHKKDLETDNPYNTYTRNGLPPTPIALPSRDAVLAAIHPDSTDALYFVATGNGGHHFSATLEEHNAAVRSYLSRRAQGGAAGAQ